METASKRGEVRGLSHADEAWVQKITSQCEAGVDSFCKNDVVRLLVLLELVRGRSR
jgi:hypothetical protein